MACPSYEDYESDFTEDEAPPYPPWAWMAWDDGDVVPMVPRGGHGVLMSDEAEQCLLAAPLKCIDVTHPYVAVFPGERSPHARVNPHVLKTYGKEIYGHCIIVQSKRFYWGKCHLTTEAPGATPPHPLPTIPSLFPPLSQLLADMDSVP